jgi:GT2 family glycosyltransferase
MARTPLPYRLQVERGSTVPTDPRTSVIVLVTADTTLLQRCLRSVRRSLSSETDPEIVVLANGTPPAALAALGPHGDIVLIRSPINHGFGGGCNLAVRFARGERLAFLNDDVEVTRGWLDALHRSLDADEHCAVVGSKVLLTDGRLQEAGSVLWSDGTTSGVGRGGDPQEQEFDRRRRVDYVSFCSAMVRRDAWAEADGFDERYFPAYYEDADLCLTLQQNGWSVVCDPESVVHHEEGASASAHLRDFLSRRNRTGFVDKWAPVLAGYEPPPAREVEREAAVRRALRRTAERVPPARPAAVQQAARWSPGADLKLGDAEILGTTMRHLAAAITVQEDYIRLLSEEAATRGVVDLLRHRLHRGRAQVKRYAQRLRGADDNRRNPQ